MFKPDKVRNAARIFCGSVATVFALCMLLETAQAAAKPAPRSKEVSSASQPTFPLLVFFRFDRISATGNRRWVLATVLPWKRKHIKATALPAGAGCFNIRPLAVLRGKRLPFRATFIIELPLIRSDNWATDFMIASDRAIATFRPGETIVVRLERTKKIDLHGLNSHCVIYPVIRGFEIPKRYVNEIAPGWKFYNTHRKMFKPKSAKANERALLALLTGKNIFLAQEAWITLLKAKPSLLSEKFVGQLIPKLGPNRQAYFVYELLARRGSSLLLVITTPIIDGVVACDRLVPIAKACAYRRVWFNATSARGVSAARSILLKIAKKTASFGAHTTADKEINKLLRLAGLKPLNHAMP